MTNSGNVTVTNVAVADTLTAPAAPALTVDCPDAPLAPGVTGHCSASYVTTQADIDAGSIDNSAVASAGAPDGTPVTSNVSTATVPVDQTPQLTLVKSVSPTTANVAGDRVDYSFQVTNSGNVTRHRSGDRRHPHRPGRSGADRDVPGDHPRSG